MKFIIVGIFLISLMIASGNAVTVTSKGVEIDLSAFTLPLTNTSYSYTVQETKNIYYFNIMDQAVPCDTKVGDKNSSVCQYIPGQSKYYSFGSFNNYTVSPFTDEPGASISYSSFTNCGKVGFRTTFLQLSCAKPNTQFEVTSVVEPQSTGGVACQLTININIPCKSTFIGGGWIFIIVILSVAVLYIIVGSIINWKVRHQHGSQIFPNIEFWKNFGCLIKDGVFFIKGKITRTPHTPGYEQI
ncbi:hypothetical protein RB653_000211 [Dictyostelium firmibasis]|uniref:Uncharacterized protein n=1 Tax=Dictyostelium firmibasis TaxID=79012 RepID=A0AAN7U5P1_9MYCE